VLRVRLVLVAVNAIGAHADEAIAHCGVLRAVTSGGAVGGGELPLLWPRVLALSGVVPTSCLCRVSLLTGLRFLGRHAGAQAPSPEWRGTPRPPSQAHRWGGPFVVCQVQSIRNLPRHRVLTRNATEAGPLAAPTSTVGVALRQVAHTATRGQLDRVVDNYAHKHPAVQSGGLAIPGCIPCMHRDRG
jgi:hypothetical protein